MRVFCDAKIGYWGVEVPISGAGSIQNSQITELSTSTADTV